MEEKDENRRRKSSKKEERRMVKKPETWGGSDNTGLGWGRGKLKGDKERAIIMIDNEAGGRE